MRGNKTITISSKLQEGVLLRAIGAEIAGLAKVIHTADEKDYMQYAAKKMALSQLEEMRDIVRQLEGQEPRQEEEENEERKPTDFSYRSNYI